MDELQNQIKALSDRVEELRGDGTTLTDTSNVSDPALLNLKPRRVLKGHFGKIYAMQWANDSTRLVSASQDGKLITWNAKTTNKVAAIPLRSSWVMTCAFAPSGKFVASGGLDNMCTIFKVEEGGAGSNKSHAELIQHEGYLSCCRFIDDQKIVTSSGDSTCIVWDINTKEAITVLDGHGGDVMSVSVADDGKTFVSGSVDATCKLWDVRDKQACVATFAGHESDINTVDMRDSMGVFATGSDDSSCRLFDLRSRRQQAAYSSDKLLSGITSVSLSGSGRYLFAGYDDFHVVAWDVLAGQPAQNIQAHENRVSCLGVSKDGSCLATGSWDTFLKCWA